MYSYECNCKRAVFTPSHGISPMLITWADAMLISTIKYTVLYTISPSCHEWLPICPPLTLSLICGMKPVNSLVGLAIEIRLLLSNSSRRTCAADRCTRKRKRLARARRPGRRREMDSSPRPRHHTRRRHVQCVRAGAVLAVKLHIGDTDTTHAHLSYPHFTLIGRAASRAYA